MEALKMIFVVALCLVVTVVVSLFMGTTPCTHLDPGSELVLLSDYIDNNGAIISCLRTLKDKALIHTHPVPTATHKHTEDLDRMVDFIADVEIRQTEYVDGMIDLLEGLMRDLVDINSDRLTMLETK